MAIWKAQRTLLIVGEGFDEVAFLTHIKRLYVSRGCGLSVTIKNARGKGARHVIEWAGRQMVSADFDVTAVLLDTDTDWSSVVESRAKKKRIQVLKSEPCFEAMMLRLLGETPVNDAKELKKQFAPFVNNDALNPENYMTHFDRERLQIGRTHEPVINTLLKLFDA